MSSTFKANRAYGSRLRRLKATVLFGDITAAGTGKTLDLAALLLPTDAIPVATALNITAAFNDGAAGVVKLDIGTAGTATLFLTGAAANLSTLGRTGGGTVSADGLGVFQGGVQPRLTFTGSVNLSTLTAGSVDVFIYYYRADQIAGDTD